MATRQGWSDRSDSYRSRLIGAGRSGKLSGQPMSAAETQAYWEGGGDLRGGRSHRPRPIGAAPLQATQRESVGLGDAKTWRELERWRKRSPARGGPPEWLRDKRKWRRRRRAAPIEVKVTEYDNWTKNYQGAGQLPPPSEGNRAELSTDTVAILSQIDIPPSRWKAVEMTFLAAGGVLVTITPKRGYDRYVIFPDATGAREVGRLLAESREPQ